LGYYKFGTAAGDPNASAPPVTRYRSEEAETSSPRADAGVAWTEESLRRRSSAIVLPFAGN
jgi:hypothetical protein